MVIPIMKSESVDDIMQKRIEQFNQFVMSQDIEKLSVGLFDGKMGICIYFYHQSRLTQNKEYEAFAEKLLDSICEQLYTELPVELETGLAGIGLGINYLVKSGFVEGNVNLVLKELDDKIFSSLSFQRLPTASTGDVGMLRVIMGLIYYFLNRLENDMLPKDQRELFQNIIIKSINAIENNPHPEKFNEPILFSLTTYSLPIYLMVLHMSYKLNFYNYKIEKIYDELTYKVTANIPLLHSNRMYLKAGISVTESVRPMPKWTMHKVLLDNYVDSGYVINNEFRDKNIFFSDGLVGYYFLAQKGGALSDLDAKLICRKIVKSDVWDDYLTDNNKLLTRLGLVNGFCGVILAYQDILQIMK